MSQESLTPSVIFRSAMRSSVAIKPDPSYRANILVQFEKVKTLKDKDNVLEKELYTYRSQRPLKRSFPRTNPNDAMSSYIRSLQNMKIMKDVPFLKDDMYISSTMARVQARRLVLESEERLRDNKRQAGRRRNAMDSQWMDLERMENSLRKAFQKFDNFVKENEEKRQRSLQRIKYFSEACERRTKELDELRRDYAYSTQIKSQMETKIKEYSMYEDFLNEAANISKEEFKCAADFITRYEALLEAKFMIKHKHEHAYRSLEETIQAMRKKEEDAMLKLIGLRNQTATLTERYEHARFKSLKWETIVASIHDNVTYLKVNLIRAKDACWNIYTGFAKRKNVPATINPDNIKDQLIFIKKALDEAIYISQITLDPDKHSSTVF